MRSSIRAIQGSTRSTGSNRSRFRDAGICEADHENLPVYRARLAAEAAQIEADMRSRAPASIDSVGIS